MSKYKLYEYGQVPIDWDVVTLGGHKEGKQILLELRNGYTGQQQQKGRYKVSRIETISGNNIDETKVHYVTDVSESILSKYLIKKGDILFTHINSDIHLGKTGLAKKDYDDLLHGMNLLLIRNNPDVVESEYLDFVFKFFRQQGVFIRICSRAVNQSSINQAKIKGLEVPLPKKKERENIIYILSTLQKAIQKQEEIINTITALKKSLLNKLFTEGTKGEPLKQTPYGMIPESWQVVPIGSLGKVVTGSTPKTSIDRYYQPGEYDFIAPVDIGKNWIVENAQKKISSEGLAVSRPLPKNTVLAVCIGSTIGKVGITSKELSATNQQINAIVCEEGSNNPFFIYYLLNFYNNLWKEAATPSPVPILTKGQFEKILIPFTDDFHEQTLMAESLKVFEKKFKCHINKKNIYESLFKTLLNELMTGTIRVNLIDFHSKSTLSKTVKA